MAVTHRSFTLWVIVLMSATACTSSRPTPIALDEFDPGLLSHGVADQKLGKDAQPARRGEDARNDIAEPVLLIA